MTKSVLGIIGSPRRHGNTHVLVSRILDGAREAGAAVETLFLADMAIRECDGCHACWQGKPCSKRDDMSGLFEQIARSDVLVFGTPVYWYGPTALMKAFLDRFVYFNCPDNRAKIKGHVAALAIPFEDTDPATAELLVKSFEKSLSYLEMNLAGCLLVPGVTRKGEIAEKADRMKEAYALGAKLAAGR
ncbi:MAG: flavodoxin family protein [Phycisphaerae bacterium]